MAGFGRWLLEWVLGPVNRGSFFPLVPKWAVRITGLLTACNREMRVQFSHRPPKLSRLAGVSEAGARRRNPESRTLRRRIWLGNSTAECWSEKPVDTVQFRAEPPVSGSGLAGLRRVPWEHEIGSSNLPSPTKIVFHKEVIIANDA